MNPAPVNTREIYQVLKDIALGTVIMRIACSQPQAKSATGPQHIEADGWLLTLHTEGDHLAYCEQCTSPDGRVATLESWQRYGTNPTELLSGWEREQLERLLKAL